jgi:hypothetical protein
MALMQQSIKQEDASCTFNGKKGTKNSWYRWNLSVEYFVSGTEVPYTEARPFSKAAEPSDALELTTGAFRPLRAAPVQRFTLGPRFPLQVVHL